MSITPKEKYIYKIISTEVWKEAVAAGVFKGHGIDLNDNFIHFSTGKQVAGTLERWFKGVAGLSLVKLSTSKFQNTDKLKWEKSRDDQLFPHLYASLDVSIVDDVFEIELDDNGVHKLPALE